MPDNSWFEGDDSVIEDASFKDYQITATPNDFNIKTIVDFVESGVVKIPGFQRNYVWDIERASRLIESLLMGLPIPQIFLYEQARNSFLVIDGQQRLMSIYYFVNGQFPRKDKQSNSDKSLPKAAKFLLRSSPMIGFSRNSICTYRPKLERALRGFMIKIMERWGSLKPLSISRSFVTSLSNKQLRARIEIPLFLKFSIVLIPAASI